MDWRSIRRWSNQHVVMFKKEHVDDNFKLSSLYDSVDGGTIKRYREMGNNYWDWEQEQVLGTCEFFLYSNI